MPRCPYYKVESKTLRSREIRPDRTEPPPQTILLPWCAHPKHSPVSKFTVTRTIGGANHRKCEGDLSKCQIVPRDKFFDT